MSQMPGTPPTTPGSRPEPGTEEWRRTIELMLRRIWDPVGIPADHLRGIEDRLDAEMAADPEAFLEIFERVQRSFGVATPDSAVNDYLVGLTEGLIDALSGAASGRARNILNNITETRTTTEEQRVTEEEVVTGEERVTRGIHEVEFVEWPTAEAVLDDFLTGFSTFAGELLRGGLDRNTYNFMVANPNRFLLPYLDELGRRADAGENIFEVVGLGDAATLLGERFGGAVREETVRVGTEERISDIELTELINTTIERLTESLADEEPQTVRDTITETIKNIFTEHRETTTRSEFQRISETLRVEEIFGRPELGVVRTPSPLAFMREAFSPMTLANIAAGEAGVPSARVGGARAVLPSAPRRLGG